MPHRRRRSGGVEGQHMVGRQATHAPPSCRRLGAALAARACAWRHGVNSKSGRTTAPHRTRRSQRRKLSSVVATGSTPRRCWGSPSPLKLTNLAALVWQGAPVRVWERRVYVTQVSSGGVQRCGDTSQYHPTHRMARKIQPWACTRWIGGGASRADIPHHADGEPPT